MFMKRFKSRQNSGNACYHSVQSLFSSRLLSRNVKVKIYTTIILQVVLYGCKTWSLTLRKEHRLRVFENRDLRGKVNELGRACGTHGREEKIVQGFGGKARRKETTRKTKA
jgi:hypothetical protein